ncbi:ABC transporter substrate-binding protein [Caenispirillum bisanense]|uniref:Dipeptide transport system substrate-binding protein n=1 Tax=Caenispirillum bisanense TaxID=414052 RepID=A0A286GNG7_9PROT|nr:ABC transporter substrate-binding protein [Caenispirillum bisanense]SOD97087.1 dipeptide transport system substrate-binding protein [Caenispirillum bisanense]
MNALKLALAAGVATAIMAGAAQAKTLVYCSEGSPEGLNPVFYTAGTTFDATSVPMYDRLVEFKQGTTEIEPGLAESWEVSEDGKTYTFNLRKGVKFHSSDAFTPSRELNADDVIWSFERQMNPEHPFHKVGGGSYEYFNSMAMGELIEKIEKVDDHTVRFHLTRPEAPMIANLGMDFASIFSAEYAQKMQEAGTPEMVDTNPIGTGPFQFVTYQKDAQLRYKAFPEYWAGKAPLDQLVFAITPDASVRYAKLKAGECHVMPYPNPADIEQMKSEKGITVMEQEGLNVGYLAYNTEKEPFTDPRVRRALDMAVNKDAIIDAVFQGAGRAAKNPLPPTMWSYNTDIQDTKYDPEGAKKLLAEAGFPNGFSTNLWAMPVQRPYNPNARRMAEVIQSDWEKIGVKAEIVSYEWGEYLKRSKEGEHQTLLLGWTGDNGDPDNFLYTLLSCDAVGSANRARWCDEEFDKLVKQAKIVSDPAKRTELYKQAQARFKDQTPWTTVAHSVVFMPMRDNVVNYKISPFGKHDFYNVDLK